MMELKNGRQKVDRENLGLLIVEHESPSCWRKDMSFSVIRMQDIRMFDNNIYEDGELY